MNLRQYIALQEITGAEHFEYTQISPISTQHPPSLKNPQRVKQDTSQQGYRKGDPKKLKDRAKSDLVEIHKRMRRQIGKPEVSYVAPMPLFPSIVHWT